MANLKYDPRVNVIAYLKNLDPKSVGYRDAISLLKSSHIHYVISHLPVIDEKQVRDFWQTVDYDLNKKPPVIPTSVHNENIFVTVDTVAKALTIEGDLGFLVVLTSEGEVFAVFKSMRYEGTELTK